MVILTKNKQIALSILASVVLGSNTYADTANIKIVGTIDGYIPLKTHTLLSTNDSGVEKHILFQKIALSPEAKSWLAQHTDYSEKPMAMNDEATLPTKVELGMNDVPVLDQGRHGTCVTFATTGALDAARGKEDYISQLCNLELGSYLEQSDSKHYSGWAGSWGDIVLNQINDYGIISLATQHKDGCAGVYDYPLSVESDTGKPMSTEEFASHSEKIMKSISFKTIASHEDAYSDKSTPATIVQQIKQALNHGHRVTFGSLLDVGVGHNGAVGTYKVNNDTWMMTPQIRDDAKKGIIEAGHEMIITGYDNNAVVMGPDHIKQTGIFILRNSWGSHAGDNGNYYMTYAHFKTLAHEAYEIIPASN